MDRPDASVEQVLAHYGVKGMRWGQRKARPSGPTEVVVTHTPGKRVKATGGDNQPASLDAKEIAALKRTAKKSSTDALTTKELKILVERMNLERQYSSLAGSSSPSEAGKKFATDLLTSVGKQYMNKMLMEQANSLSSAASKRPKA